MVKWAIADGNWNDGGIWNDGAVPSLGDEVYCNGHIVNINQKLIDLGNGTFRNDSFEDENIVAGGYFLIISGMNDIELIGNSYAYSRLFVSANYGNFVRNYIGDIVVASEYLFALSSQSTFYKSIVITGNVSLLGSSVLARELTYQRVPSITINGNVSIESGSICENVIIGGVLNINGNVYTNGKLCNQNLGSLIVNGNITQNTLDYLVGTCNVFTFVETYSSVYKLSNGTITELNISGTLNCKNDKLANYPITTTNISEGGRITYTSKCPMGWGELNAQSDFNFECVGTDIGTHRIINKTLLDNTYPAESNVEHGIAYGYSGEKTGTFQQPQENVVMEGYVYDFGQKTGTLSIEIPQDVTEQLEDIDANMLAVKNAISNSERLIAETKGWVANLPSEQFIAELLGD